MQGYFILFLSFLVIIIIIVHLYAGNYFAEFFQLLKTKTFHYR